MYHYNLDSNLPEKKFYNRYKNSFYVWNKYIIPTKEKELKKTLPTFDRFLWEYFSIVRMETLNKTDYIFLDAELDITKEAALFYKYHDRTEFPNAMYVALNRYTGEWFAIPDVEMEEKLDMYINKMRDYGLKLKTKWTFQTYKDYLGY